MYKTIDILEHVCYNVYMAKFHEQRTSDNIEKLGIILENDLPDFCQDYFIGIEQRTTALTRLNYAYDIRLFMQYLCFKVTRFFCKTTRDITLIDIEELSPNEIERYLSWLSSYKDPTLSPEEAQKSPTITNNEAGKKRKLSSIRVMVKFFVKKKLLQMDPTSSVDTPKLRSKDIVRLERGEIGKMLEAIDTGNGLSEHQRKYLDNTKLRDMVIVNFLLATGIRVSELVGMDIADIDMSNLSFAVTRKGGARVILYFPADILPLLQEYYAQRIDMCKQLPKENALFLSLQNKRLGTRSVENIVKKYSQLATPLKNISPHKLRSTFGTQLYRATGDIYVVADVLGHKDVNTTKKHYAAISDDIRKNASTKVDWLNDDQSEDE